MKGNIYTYKYMHGGEETLVLLILLFCVDLKRAKTHLNKGLYIYIYVITIIRACACWALFVVTLTNTVHSIYKYIYMCINVILCNDEIVALMAQWHHLFLCWFWRFFFNAEYESVIFDTAHAMFLIVTIRNASALSIKKASWLIS